jgi:hypothetical protein
LAATNHFFISQKQRPIDSGSNQSKKECGLAPSPLSAQMRQPYLTTICFAIANPNHEPTPLRALSTL